TANDPHPPASHLTEGGSVQQALGFLAVRNDLHGKTGGTQRPRGAFPDGGESRIRRDLAQRARGMFDGGGAYEHHPVRCGRGQPGWRQRRDVDGGEEQRFAAERADAFAKRFAAALGAGDDDPGAVEPLHPPLLLRRDASRSAAPRDSSSVASASPSASGSLAGPIISPWMSAEPSGAPTRPRRRMETPLCSSA